jgi:hypothetical protein
VLHFVRLLAGVPRIGWGYCVEVGWSSLPAVLPSTIDADSDDNYQKNDGSASSSSFDDGPRNVL